MNRFRKHHRILIVGACLLIPAIVWILQLDPGLLSGSGWYGYGGNMVVPEVVSSSSISYHGIRDRRSSTGCSSCGSCGSGSVQPLNGVLGYSTDGISFPGVSGLGFDFKLTYNNNHENGTTSTSDGDIELPWGWNWHSGIFQLVDMGSDEIRLVGRGDSSDSFVEGTGADVNKYFGQFGVDAMILHETADDEMVLLSTNGSQAVFFDFDSSHGEKAGGLKSISDAYGNEITVNYVDAGQYPNLTDLVASIDDTTGRTWVFSYIDDSQDVNNRKLSSIELMDGATLLKSIDFVHHDGTSSFASGSGSVGDLMQITVTEQDSNGDDLSRTTLFRYYAYSYSQSNPGNKHKLRYIVGPQSYVDLAGAVSDPLQATNAEVEDHADYMIEYNSSSFVTSLSIRGTGCSCSSGEGTGTTSYEYTTNSSWTSSSGPGVWKVRVEQTNPDQTFRIVDVNGAGGIINDVFQTNDVYDGTDQRWITHREYDSSWRVTEIHPPSACSSYSESTHAMTPASTGMVDLFTYDADGNLTEKKLKDLSTSTQYYLEKREYIYQTLGEHKVHFLSKVTVYSSVTDYDETAISYPSFYPDTFDFDRDGVTTEESSLAIQERQVTLPAVSANHNGENSPHTRRYYYNSAGELEWEKDEAGSITFRDYDDVTGMLAGTLIQVVVDVNAGAGMGQIAPPTRTTIPRAALLLA